MFGTLSVALSVKGAKDHTEPFAIGAIANAKSILEQTIDYVKERKAFGTEVASFQNTQFKLAELDTDVTVAEAYVDRCIELHLEEKFDAVAAAKAKLMATELQGRVTDECLQLHGGYGYIREYPLERHVRDTRVHQILEGTNEIMRVIIGRRLLMEGALELIK